MISPAPGTPAPTNDAMLQMIQGTARIVGSVFQWFGQLGEWVALAVFVVALVAPAFSCLFWLTATGLAHDRLWARVLASLCGLGFALAASIILSIRNAH